MNGFYDEAASSSAHLSPKQALRPSIEDVFPSVQLCLKLAAQAAQRTAEVPARS